MKHITLLLFYSLFFNALLFAQPGTLDKTFGDSGKVLLAGVAGTTSMSLQKNGKMITLASQVAIRFNQDGSLDESFGDSGYAILNFDIGYHVFKSLVVQEDDKILVGGYGSDYTNLYDTAHQVNYNIILARLLPDGNIDSSFGENGVVNTDLGNQEYCYDITLQTDGKIVAAGIWEEVYPSFGHFLVARYLPDGSVDMAFGTNGETVTEFGLYTFTTALSAAIQSDNKIVLAGATYGPESSVDTKCAFARYMPDGTLDAGFGYKGQTIKNITPAGDNISKVSIAENGTILACGYAGQNILGEKQSFLLLSLNNDGTLNNNFGDSGIVITKFEGLNSVAASMAIQNNGRIILGGTSWRSDDDYSFDFVLTRHNEDGSLDSSFGVNGKQTTDFGDKHNDGINAVAINNSNNIIVAGNSNLYADSVYYYLALARYNGDPLSRITRIKRWIKHHVLNFQDLQAGSTAYFSIERSYNNNDSFKEIGRVNSNNTTQDYSFTDNTSSQGTNFYRIKAIDNDGSVAYSDVISETDNNATASSFSMYPNPVKDVLHVNGLNASANTSLSILNAQGNILRSVHVNAYNYELNVNQLKQGTYYLKVEESKKRVTYKFLKE